MKQKLTILSIITTLLFCGCVSPMKTFNDNSNGWKPNDFVPSKGILLIEKIAGPKNQQKKIEEFMAKSYPYKYEFVDTKDLSGNNEKYNDKSTYRFALVSAFSTHTLHQNTTEHPLNVGAFDFNFIDRLNDKEYPKSGIASSWASMTFKKIIETCLKN